MHMNYLFSNYFKRMLKIAHRGYSYKYKDNTLPAFLGAIEEGFDMIELDIQMCKDCELVIYHDLYIEGYFVKDLCVEELKKINPDLLLLNELFDAVSIDSILFYLDLKGNMNIIHLLMPLLNKRFSYDQLKRFYISGFDRHYMDLIKCYDVPAYYGFTTDNNLHYEDLKYMVERNYYNKIPLQFVCFHWTCLDNMNIQYLHKHNIQVFTYISENVEKPLPVDFTKQFSLDGIVMNYLC